MTDSHDQSSPEPAGTSTPSTSGAEYSDRLVQLESVWWKRLLDVQRPYRWNLRRQELGRTLDVGCGIGRNLAGLSKDSVGVDHNAQSVAVARTRGYTALTSDEFLASDAREGSFDAMLLAHVVEHMTADEARELVSTYLPFVRPGGRVLFICPQRRGYATDATHVEFYDFASLRSLAESVGLTVAKAYSFPLPAIAGGHFAYNEFCVLAVTPGTDA